MRVGRTIGTMDPTFNGYVTVPPTPPEYGGMGGLTVVPDAARWLNARQEIETDEGERVLVQSAHATRRLEMAVLLPSAMHALSADNECEHGGLPVDHAPQPGCTPECAGYPQLLPLPIEPEELDVSAITETHHGATDATDPEAPYGRKDDGSPRKKPAPSPEHVEAIRRGHRERAARRAAEREAAAVETPPAPALPEAEVGPVAPEPEPIIGRMVAIDSPLVAGWLIELDERVHTLQDEIGERERELAELTTVRERLVA